MTPPLQSPDEAKIEQLFLDRIVLIDQINHFGIGREEDERDAFILLGTPAELITALLDIIRRADNKDLLNISDWTKRGLGSTNPDVWFRCLQMIERELEQEGQE